MCYMITSTECQMERWLWRLRGIILRQSHNSYLCQWFPLLTWRWQTKMFSVYNAFLATCPHISNFLLIWLPAKSLAQRGVWYWYIKVLALLVAACVRQAATTPWHQNTSMTITAEDCLCAKVAVLNSSLGRHFPPNGKQYSPQMLGSLGPRSSLTRRCSSVSDCTTEKTGNRKASLTESTATRGEGTRASARVSLATGRKLTLTSWLPSKTRLRASAGYFHGTSKKKKKRDVQKLI